MTAATYSRSIHGHYLSGHDVPLRITVTFVWLRADPLCVQLRILTRPKAVVWNLSRELLAHGLQATAGIGDVRLAPDLDDDVLHVSLSVDDFVAQFDLPLWEVATFLESLDHLMPDIDTSAAVLAGLDDELAQLLTVPGGDA